MTKIGKRGGNAEINGKKMRRGIESAKVQKYKGRRKREELSFRYGGSRGYRVVIRIVRFAPIRGIYLH
jgi:hypothetical protein